MNKYISINQLRREQNKLMLNLIDYNIDEEWQSHKIISNLREKLYELMPSGNFDPQDLEHQVLFRLTTFNPIDITDNLIIETIREQRVVIEDRLKDVANLEYIFRGLSGFYKDLNIKDRLTLKHEDDRIYATNGNCQFEVEFKKITENKIIELFTEKLHYIHSSRHNGDTFGLFFKGDPLPWGVETTESSISTKKYKRDSLIAHGIDPNKAIEITRLYLLPGSPKNSISILDGLVAKYYKNLGIEAMFTTTMPMYAKTKGATIAGGMNKILLTKELNHSFIKKEINNKEYYVHSLETKKSSVNTISTHSLFPTLLTVETYMRLNKNPHINPLEELANKTIYVDKLKRIHSKTSEIKFLIKDLDKILCLSSENYKYNETKYIKDDLWGSKNSINKIRLRKVKILSNNNIIYEVSTKRRISKHKHITSIVNDILYKGPSLDNAISKIKIIDNDFKKENSYERIRVEYEADSIYLKIDIYPFGCYLKIEGDENQIWKIAEHLGFTRSENISINSDELYLSWSRSNKLTELWNVSFGLKDDRE